MLSGAPPPSPNRADGTPHCDVVRHRIQPLGSVPVQIDYEPLNPVAVKGKLEPVPLWRALGARSRFGVDVEIGEMTPLVGRDSELSLLKEAYTRVRRDESVQLVTLVGEAGVGKTRLLRELLASRTNFRTSSDEGGRPVRSKVARRMSVSLFAWGAGRSPFSSSFARMN